MNRVFLIGNLTRDPELSETESGTSVCRFGIAINRNYTNADGERQADYFNIIVWRTLAVNCGRYLKKGNKVAIFGNLQSRIYEDKDGNKRSVIDIIANEVEFLSPRASDNAQADNADNNARAAGSAKPTPTLTQEELDDLPF